MDNIYYVYIATNFSNTCLYVGVTNNIFRRAFEHKSKVHEGFTKKYNIYKVIYVESTGNVNDAIAREKQIKRWSRAKKTSLINSINPEWNDLLQD